MIRVMHTRVAPSFAICFCLLIVCAPVVAADAGKRIVTVGGDVTEIVYALGAGEIIVGRDATSLWPPEVTAKPDVGYLRNLAAEGLLSLDPDLIIASHDAGPETTLEQLRDAGVDIIRLPKTYAMEAIPEKVRDIATAIDREDEGAALAAKIEADWQAAKAEIALLEGEPRVLFFLAVGDGSPMAAGTSTAASAIITLTGADNAFSSHEGYKALSLEAAAAANPDVILAMSHSVRAVGGVEGLADHPALRITTAAREGRIIEVDPSSVMTFGPRTPRAVLALARQMHGSPKAESAPTQ